MRSPEDGPNKRKNSLGQEDFLKLMTTQLQNQDPFAPMENGEFIAQMAQFSTVTGITEMGQTLKGLSDKLNEFRIATASDLLGNSVCTGDNKANKEVRCAPIDLPSASVKHRFHALIAQATCPYNGIGCSRSRIGWL